GGLVDRSLAAQTSAAVGTIPSAVAVAAVDGAGDPDVTGAHTGAEANPGTSVSVLRGQAGGTFAAQMTFPVGTSPSAVAVADVDGDRHRDLIVANIGSGGVSGLRGQAGGTFAARTTFPVGTSPSAVAVSE